MTLENMKKLTRQNKSKVVTAIPVFSEDHANLVISNHNAFTCETHSLYMILSRVLVDEKAPNGCSSTMSSSKPIIYLSKQDNINDTIPMPLANERKKNIYIYKLRWIAVRIISDVQSKLMKFPLPCTSKLSEQSQASFLTRQLPNTTLALNCAWY